MGNLQSPLASHPTGHWNLPFSRYSAVQDATCRWNPHDGPGNLNILLPFETKLRNLGLSNGRGVLYPFGYSYRFLCGGQRWASASCLQNCDDSDVRRLFYSHICWLPINGLERRQDLEEELLDLRRQENLIFTKRTFRTYFLHLDRSHRMLDHWRWPLWGCPKFAFHSISPIPRFVALLRNCGPILDVPHFLAAWKTGWWSWC